MVIGVGLTQVERDKRYLVSTSGFAERDMRKEWQFGLKWDRDFVCAGSHLYTPGTSFQVFSLLFCFAQPWCRGQADFMKRRSMKRGIGRDNKFTPRRVENAVRDLVDEKKHGYCGYHLASNGNTLEMDSTGCTNNRPCT